MRAVFDTNIFISAFVIPGGKAEEAYLQAVRATFELFTSIAISLGLPRLFGLSGLTRLSSHRVHWVCWVNLGCGGT